MRPDDLPKVLEIASGLPEAPQWAESAYEKVLDPEAIPARIGLIAEHPETGVSGFAITVLIPPQAELESIAVAADCQRQGIGGHLVSELLSMLRKRGISEVILEVRESNLRARRFYALTGFAETGRRRAYYTQPEEDAILLSRMTDRAPNSARNPGIE